MFLYSDSKMEKRGSESCPIDLTDDESHAAPAEIRKKQKVKHRESAFQKPKKAKKSERKKQNVAHEDVRMLFDRVQTLEEKMSDNQQKRDSQSESFASNLATGDLLNRCENLEQRLESLENCLKRFTKSLCSDNNSDNSEPNEAVTLNLEEADSSEEDNKSVDKENFQVPISNESNHQDTENVDETTETNYIVPEPTGGSHNEGINASDHLETFEPPNLNSVEHEVCEVTDYGERSVQRNDDRGNEMTTYTTASDDTVDVKPIITWVNQEVNMQRDDQGRILVILHSAAKRLNKTSPLIVAVAGTYIGSDLHNEFVFESSRSMRDVKTEGDIRAALFGIETIKGLFEGPLDQVCLMMISSNQYLVNHMKTGKVYQNFYSCRCKNRDCIHAEKRWYTEESLGKAQCNVLPDLMISMQALNVHWCKVEQLSPEEKVWVDLYHKSVEEVLGLHLRHRRNNQSSI